MATYTTSRSATYGPTPGVGDATQEVVLTAIVAVTTAMIDNANDEVGLFWVPKGFMPTSIAFHATDMDTNGSPALVWDVGDDSDEDRLMAAITTGQAAGSSTALATTGFLYKYTSRTLIKAYVNTAAATGAAGTIKVALKGIIDPEYSTTALTAA